LKVSTILCHHKGNLVYGALTSLLASKGVDLQIILMTSTLPSHIKAIEKKFPMVKIVEMPGGPAIKRNVGIKFAEHSLIAFFDDDVEVCPWTVYEMAKVLQTEKVGMVFGKILNMEFREHFDEAGSYLTSSGFLWARAESGCQDVGQFDKVEPILSGKSAACMVHRKVFSEVGMFDASYEILAEETDLSWRVWLYGYQVLFVPSSITYHAFNTKFKPSDFYTAQRVYLNGCRNYIAMLVTNLGKMELIVPVVIQFVVWMMAGICFIITGKFEAGINVFRGIGWVITHWDNILSKRIVVQRARKVSDKDLMPIIRRNPPISYYIDRFFSYIKHGKHGGSHHPVKS